MHESLHTALIELGFRARELAALAEQLAASAAPLAPTPPAEQSPRTEAGELTNPRVELRTGPEPTVITEAMAGPQGCTHHYASGKWCALEAEHPGPHTPAFTGGAA